MLNIVSELEVVMREIDVRARRWYPEDCQCGVVHFSREQTGEERVTKDLFI